MKDVRDKAVAFQHYFKMAKNLEAERQAVEIRIRAERKAGQLMREMEKDKGGGDTRKKHLPQNGEGANDYKNTLYG